jgi:ribosomal protein S18 acetylase RimI-like enzyme
MNRIQIRPVGSDDRAALRDFLAGLSTRTRYYRFFAGSVPASPAMLGVLTGSGRAVDAIVAVRDGAIIGHAMAVDTAGPGGAVVSDLGVVVADAWQRQGVGSRLMRILASRARARGASSVTMDVLAENRPMLSMISGHWPAARQHRNGPYLTFAAPLAPARPS